MAREPGPMHRLLAFLDPLLRRAPLVMETHYRPAGQAQIRDDEANSRKQLSDVELHLRYYPPRRFPTGRLLEKAFVPDHWFVARPSHWPRQQFRNVPLQAIVGWNFVDLRFGKGRVRPESNLLALCLLTLDFRQQHFVPVLGAVYVARTQLRRQAVPVTIEQKQRVVADRLEVSVVALPSCSP